MSLVLIMLSLLRVASGMFPEHTARAYREAARQGADVIECDLAITKVLATKISLKIII